jgi:TonB family protein
MSHILRDASGISRGEERPAGQGQSRLQTTNSRLVLVIAGASLFAACGIALAQGNPEVGVPSRSPVSTNETACPIPPKNRAPEYPRHLLEEETTGTVWLATSIDACGRVTSVTLQKSSGHNPFDDAAIRAVRGWTLGPARRARAIDGVVSLRVEFNIDNFLRAPDWPKTHGYPHYELADDSGGYADAADAESAIDALNPSSRMAPYAIAGGSFVQLDTTDGREFWYFIYDANKPVVAVRYQPVFDNGEPIVRLTVICDKQPKQCDAIRKLMMKGLGYAHAKR